MVINLADHIAEKYKNVRSIGLTGQMHGILYIDKNGDAVSPLFTWQDSRADSVMESGLSCREEIFLKSRERVAAGYGLATHYYNVKKGLVPANAHSFCSIMDYAAMKLTGSPKPLVHASVAASFGMFDIKSNEFKKDIISALGIENIALPAVTSEFTVAGQYRGIPVSVGIGDNQASFLGSVKSPDDSILINIGTGSQVSAAADRVRANALPAGTEYRPLAGDKYLCCGAALCGGASYALLERFFNEFASALLPSCGSQYDTMNRLAMIALEQKMPPLTVDARFSGTRDDPARTGAVLSLTDKNFTPGQLILGFIYGICRELYELTPDFIAAKKSVIVASGNAVRKNKILRQALSDVFKKPVFISLAKEEAALGAALTAAVSAGLISPGNFAGFIQYEKEQYYERQRQKRSEN